MPFVDSQGAVLEEQPRLSVGYAQSSAWSVANFVALFFTSLVPGSEASWAGGAQRSQAQGQQSWRGNGGTGGADPNLRRRPGANVRGVDSVRAPPSS
mmetsp:Transcript_64404/g.134396  ORF Transcript_64404/g.134396 Transcript_64404/m.134396 type:complete len:97 (-) Transcript_64404:203-493(-)